MSSSNSFIFLRIIRRLYTKNKKRGNFSLKEDTSSCTPTGNYSSFTGISTSLEQKVSARPSKRSLHARAKGLCSLEWDIPTRLIEGSPLARVGHLPTLGGRPSLRSKGTSPHARRETLTSLGEG